MFISHLDFPGYELPVHIFPIFVLFTLFLLIDLKSAEYPLKESKMCIRPRWQMPKVQALK